MGIGVVRVGGVCKEGKGVCKDWVRGCKCGRGVQREVGGV